MAGPNLLIGAGETLARSIPRRGGGGPKAYPYAVEERRAVLAPQLQSVIEGINALPSAVKRHDQAVGLVTVHPAFLAKTHLPGKTLKHAGLASVGSRATHIVPKTDARVSAPPGEQFTAQLYVRGSASAFAEFRRLLLDVETPKALLLDFLKIERVDLLHTSGRMVGLEGNDRNLLLEVVLHADESDQTILHDFEEYARSCGGIVSTSQAYRVPGLIFVPVAVSREQLESLAEYSPLRAMRRMPEMRINRPSIRHAVSGPAVDLPLEGPLDPNMRVAVFDAGLGITDFSKWCSEYVHTGTAASSAEYLGHGVDVTSTVLFGHIAPDADKLDRPKFSVDHHRVIGPSDKDVDLYAVMHRVDKILAEGRYSFGNLSLGPALPIDDDQPHAWTCMLDAHLSHGKMLLTVAVGNEGNIQGPMGRVQSPADAVNALAVGAADSEQFLWNRADYSCRGPGRSPGRVKPDGLVFGGTSAQPFRVFNPYQGGLSGVQGTSFAAPYVLRAAADAAVASETTLSSTALRALLIHHAEKSDHHRLEEVGWGRLPTRVEDILRCEDNQATVLYQGSLEPAVPLRARLPIPPLPMGTSVSISATLCFCSPVEPAHPVNYTKHGLTIVFRPTGPKSSLPFFSRGNYESEQELRSDGHKWETILHHVESFKSHELADAYFDIEHGARDGGMPIKKAKAKNLPYVLVITLTLDTSFPLYNAVLQRFQTLQPIRLRQQLRIG